MNDPRAALAGSAPGGSGCFSLDPGPRGPAPGRPVDVHYQIPPPAPARPSGAVPVLIVMPGMRRNAEHYRNVWARAAAERGALLLVPELPARRYPTWAYNLAGLADDRDRPTPPERWTGAVIEWLYDVVGGDTAHRRGYHLYGHSAGAQLVHRHVLFHPRPRLVGAVAANAGWYTQPDPAVAFPFGFSGAPDRPGPAEILARPLTVLLGADDTDPADPNLERSDGAEAQGRHRLARGRAFAAAAERLAAANGLPLRWQVRVVPDVGHTNRGMVTAAVDALFGPRPGAGARSGRR